jgi:CRP/FNR family cyclic AMP-dependent transcriptional regulator
VIEGSVRLTNYTPSGLERVAIVLRPGMWFGELSVLDGKARPHDAIADNAVRASHLSMAAVTRLAAIHPEFWRDIALLSCERQRLGMRNTARIQTQPAIVRLAAFLLSSHTRAADGVVRTTQENLAQVVGISRQRVNATLGELKALGLVRPLYGGIEIPDPARLRAFRRSHEGTGPD